MHFSVDLGNIRQLNYFRTPFQNRIILVAKTHEFQFPATAVLYNVLITQLAVGIKTLFRMFRKIFPLRIFPRKDRQTYSPLIYGSINSGSSPFISSVSSVTYLVLIVNVNVWLAHFLNACSTHALLPVSGFVSK